MNAPFAAAGRTPDGSRDRAGGDRRWDDPAVSEARRWQGAVLLAFMIAPGVGCLVFDAVFLVAFAAAGDGAVEWAAVVFAPVAIGIFGAYPIAAVFGVPAYLLVRNLRVDAVGAAFTGCLVAAAPFLLLVLVSGTLDTGTVQLQFAVALGLSGTAAGAAFWALTFRRWPSRPREGAPSAVAEPRPPEPVPPAAPPLEPWRLSS